MEIILLGLLAFIIVIGLWAWKVQNSLVGIDEMCSNALSQIGIQQESRWDALTQLNAMTKSYSEHEYNTIQMAINARKHLSNGIVSANEVTTQEQKFEQIMSRLMMVVEAYPNLKANEIYLMNMEYLKNYEDQVRYTRLMYNEYVSRFNRQIRMIPTCFIARFIGFRKRDYIDTAKSKTSMPNF